MLYYYIAATWGVNNIIYRIEFEEKVTTYNFYNSILPKLHYYFRSDSRNKSEILIDFSNVEFINPNVIPNILTIGLILKSYYLEPVKLYIPWKPKLLSYLSDIDFFTIVRKYDIFSLYERNIGDYPTDQINREYKTYCFDEDTPKSNIRDKLKKSINVIKTIYESKDSDEYLDEIMKIIYIFTEVCHNSCTHSEKSCFAAFQSNISEKTKYKKAYISISDSGVGYYRSLVRKLEEKKFKPVLCTENEFINLGANKNFIAILEAIFYRSNSENYGLFHVISEIASINGIIRIHSEDTQLIITRSFYEEYLINVKKTNYYSIKKIYDCFIEGKNNAYDNVRHFKNIYKGVHLELEIPVSGGKEKNDI